MLDVVFRAFFMRNKDSLILMLENFLPLPQGVKIEDLEYLEERTPPHLEEKESVLDLRLLLKDNKKVNVEMQISATKVSWKEFFTIGPPSIGRGLTKVKTTRSFKTHTLWFLQTSICFLRQRIL